MKQGDYVKWIFGPHDERAIAEGTILKKLTDDRFAVYFSKLNNKIQYFKESELRIIQAAE